MLVLIYGVGRGLAAGSSFIMVSGILAYASSYYMVSRALKFVARARIGGVNTLKPELLAGGVALIGLGLFLRIAQLVAVRVLKPKDEWVVIIVGWGLVAILAALLGGLVAVLVSLPRIGVSRAEGGLRPLPRT